MRYAAAQALCSVALLASGAWAENGTVTWNDQRWDQSARRTDLGNSGIIHAGTRLPDLLSATLSAWQSPTASTDPYTGSAVSDPEHAHLFRMDLVFDGLVNPPGRLGDGQTTPYEPLLYGPSPVYGFLEIDADRDRDTGGELGPAARTRYLANVARFGRLPKGSIADRVAVWGCDLDRPFGEAPNYRASGADFYLSLCGCFAPAIVSEGGNGNHIFDADETWIVRGAFLHRAGGYRDASFCFGGSSGVPGLYDPQVNLRFSHSSATNQTTITLVYALDMNGAGQLVGAPAEAIDYNAGNQTSIQEAVQDVIDAVGILPLSGPVWTLAHRWDGRSANQALDPTEWRVFGLFGTASAELVESAYIWTDTGFDDVAGDMNADELANIADRAIVRQQIVLLDAGPWDAEGPFLDNGQVRIIGFGANFSLYDINGDGLINNTDLNWYCTPDFDGDGRLTVNDFGAYLNAFTARDPRADLNHNGSFDLNDLIAFGNAFAGGCP